MSHERSKGAAFRRSATVALVLALLTVVEMFAALNFNSLVILMLLATFKAVLVLNYFMHVSRLWTAEEH
ncbi:MAG: cytochrome C oxidase subunit IV family protein [Caldilineaceae bacterium]|nr:cytochrome C oxidase subunit IV family protein [Caldilineaceae bacterium]